MKVLFAKTGLLECFIVCLFISLRNRVFKKIRNVIRAPNSLDFDQVPYIVGPDLGPKCLQSRRYHKQS